MFKVRCEQRTPNDLDNGEYETDYHNNRPEAYARVRWYLGFSTDVAQFDVAKRREDISQRCRACGSNQFEYGSEVASDQSHGHSTHNQGRGKQQMPVHVERLVREPVCHHDRSTNECLEWERGEHV